jgi:hypothetical protein
MKDRKGGTPVVMTSIPAMNRLIDPFTNQNTTAYERLLIKLKDPSNKQHINKVIQDFKKTFSPVQSNNVRIYNYF